MPAEKKPDVAIVGAGPVGLTLALLLANQGHHVAVYERWMAPYPLPRAIGMGPDILRLFQSAGMLEAFYKHLDIGDGSISSDWITRDGEILMQAELASTSESGFPLIIAFNLPDLEVELNKACVEHPLVSVERGWEAVSIDQSTQYATLNLDPVDGDKKRSGDPISVQAKIIVGCDGTNSVVQSQMNTKVHDTGFASRWLVVDVKPNPETLAAFPYRFGQLLDSERTVTFVPSGPGRRRFEFIIRDDETEEDVLQPERVWEFLEFFDINPENSELVRTATYHFGGSWSENWRDGRVLLAGDSAHRMPPFLGQGFCSGIRDASTLAWAMDLVLQDKARLELLDNYTNERLPHVKTIVEQSVQFGEMICITDPQAAESRNNMMRTMRDNPDMSPPEPPPWRLGPGIWQSDCEHAGYLGVQAQVAHKGQITLLDNITGGGWHFLGHNLDPLKHLSDTAQKQWQSLGGHTINIVDDASVDEAFADTEGNYAEWFAKLDACAVIVRPDCYVYGTATSTDDIEVLLTHLTNQLSQT